MTLTKEELLDYKLQVEQAFVEVELRFTELNDLGYKGDMHEANELMTYYYLINDIVEHDYDDNTYQTIVSNKDLARMMIRVKQLRYKN